MAETPPRRRGRRKKADLPAETPQQVAARAERKRVAEEFGEVLGRARRGLPKSGSTKLALARKAGVDRNTVHQVEAGRMSPTLDVLMRLVRAAGLRIVVQGGDEPASNAEQWVYPPFPTFK